MHLCHTGAVRDHSARGDMKRQVNREMCTAPRA